MLVPRPGNITLNWNIGGNESRVRDFCRYSVKTCISTHFHRHDGNFSVFFQPSISDLERSETSGYKIAWCPTPAPIPLSFAIDLSSYTVDLSTTLLTATAATTTSTTVEDPGNHCRRPLPATNTTKFISLFFSLKSRSFSLLLLKVI